MTPTEFLRHVRTDFNSFVDTDWGRSNHTDRGEHDLDEENEQRWEAAEPIGLAVHIDIGGPDNGSVIASLAELRRWRFSTLWTEVDACHPVGGNRERGIHGNHNSTYIYTRAADRLTTIADQTERCVFLGLPFFVADQLWKRLQKGARTHVNDNGGSATAAFETSVRLDWDDVRDRFRDLPVTWQ